MSLLPILDYITSSAVDPTLDTVFKDEVNLG
jgi:hypothetical protein